MRDPAFSQKRPFADAHGVEWWAYAPTRDGQEDGQELVFFCPDRAERRRVAWQSPVDWLEELTVQELRELLGRAESF